MGTRGPVPKREDQRRRRNSPEVETATAPSANPDGATAPPAEADWHPIARRWYDSLVHSGQAFFFEPSDWAQAAYVAEAMSRNLNQGQRLSGQLFASVISAASDLLTTEGSRRRLRIELSKAEASEVDSGIAELMAAYKAQQ
ncbi:phage terminase small subunit [Streptomyces katsurahamanus]